MEIPKKVLYQTFLERGPESGVRAEPQPETARVITAAAASNISFFMILPFQKKLLLVDDQTIAIDSTFDGDTEEGVIPDVFGTGTGERSTGGAATGEGGSSDNGDGEDEKFLHNFLHNILRFPTRIPP